MLVIVLAVSYWSSRIVRFLTGMLLIIIVAPSARCCTSRAPELRLPWAPLFHLPLVKNSYPSRLMLFAFLALAVATALFLATRPRGLPGCGGRSPSWCLRRSRWNVPALRWPARHSAGLYQHRALPAAAGAQRDRRGRLQRRQRRHAVAGRIRLLHAPGRRVSERGREPQDRPPRLSGPSHATPTRSQVRGLPEADKSERSAGCPICAVPGHGIFAKIGLHRPLVDGVVVYRVNGCRSCRSLDQGASSSTGEKITAADPFWRSPRQVWPSGRADARRWSRVERDRRAAEPQAASFQAISSPGQHATAAMACSCRGFR